MVTCFLRTLYDDFPHTRHTALGRARPARACPVFHPLFTGIGPEAETKSNPVTLRIKYLMGFVPEKVVFVPIWLRNQIWDRIPLFLGSASGKQLWRWRRGQPRRTTQMFEQMFGPGRGVVGAWTLLRDVGTSARNRRVAEPTR